MAKPKLALIPSAQGSKFYSVLPSSGVGDFDFTRSGSATRINSQGLIESVANGVSRLNYPMIDGVVKGCPHHILEPQRTNLIQYSEDFSNAYWQKLNNVTVSAEKVISPDGTLNASQLIFDGTSQGRIERPITGLTQGADYTVSVYARVSSSTQIVRFGSVGDFEYTLTTEWQRLTSTQAENDTTAYPRLKCDDAVTIEVWGFQIEQGSYATSYIPNYGTAATVTRSAETATGSGDASTFNNTEGVLMAEISALNNDGLKRSISLNDGSSSNRFILRFGVNDNTIEVVSASNNSALLLSSVTVPSTLTSSKVAIKWDSNNYVFYVNGIIETTKNDLITPLVLNNLDFNDGNVGLNPFYGNTKQVQYYDSALTDSELETLTSWVSFSDMAQGQLYSIK